MSLRELALEGAGTAWWCSTLDMAHVLTERIPVLNRLTAQAGERIWATARKIRTVENAAADACVSDSSAINARAELG